jgi:hypothetical protein
MVYGRNHSFVAWGLVLSYRGTSTTLDKQLGVNDLLYQNGVFHRLLCVPCMQVVYRGAMKGKMIVTCPLPPERIPKFQLLYKDI